MIKSENQKNPVGKPQATDSSCAKCGACTAVCPVYQVTGNESLTARGRLHLLQKITEDKYPRTYLDIISQCLLCGACRKVCPRGIDIPAKVADIRHNSKQTMRQGSLSSSVVKCCLSHKNILATIGHFLKISDQLLDKLPADSGLRLKFGIPSQQRPSKLIHKKVSRVQDADGSTPSMLFPGCLARHLTPDVTSDATNLISCKTRNSPHIPAKQSCCGLAFFSSGNLTKAKNLAKLNITTFAENDAPIIVLCGSCFSHLQRYPDLMAEDEVWHSKAISFANRLQEFSSFMTDDTTPKKDSLSQHNKSSNMRILYHDPCHLLHNERTINAPRQLLKRLTGIELVELPGGPQCCGFGGLFNLAHSDLSNRIAAKLKKEILSVAPDIIVTTCSGCLVQLRKHLCGVGSKIEVLHLTKVLAEAEKYNVP